MTTRFDLDLFYGQNQVQPVLEEKDGKLLVWGAKHLYKLWVDASDESLTPCLTGKVGGMQGAWENWVTAWHFNNLPLYDQYIDIGANVGYFTFLATSMGLEALAVEANPDYMDLIWDSIKENNNPNVMTMQVAMSDVHDEDIELHIPTTLHGSASVYDIPGFETRSVTVTTTTLDYWKDLPGSRKTLIKMDVEGHEQAVFRGALDFNAENKPTYILEYTHDAYDGNFLSELQDYGIVTVVNLDGGEDAVPMHIIEESKDWITLVVRPHA